MSGCWCKDPKERPHFSELCSLMDQHLSMVSDYTELNMELVEEPEVHGMAIHNFFMFQLTLGYF